MKLQVASHAGHASTKLQVASQAGHASMKLQAASRGYLAQALVAAVPLCQAGQVFDRVQACHAEQDGLVLVLHKLVCS